MRARWAGGSIRQMTAKTVDVSTPPPMPCRPRSTISWVMSWARPHSAVVTHEVQRADHQEQLAAVHVAQLAEIGTTAVLVSMYAVVTQA